VECGDRMLVESFVPDVENADEGGVHDAHDL
jgi:hypothetical protein